MCLCGYIFCLITHSSVLASNRQSSSVNGLIAGPRKGFPVAASNCEPWQLHCKTVSLPFPIRHPACVQVVENARTESLFRTR